MREQRQGMAIRLACLVVIVVIVRSERLWRLDTRGEAEDAVFR